MNKLGWILMLLPIWLPVFGLCLLAIAAAIFTAPILAVVPLVLAANYLRNRSAPPEDA